MKASDLSTNACVVLELLSDKQRHTAKAMSAQLEMKRTTLRNALQRIEAFGLITMTELEKNRFEYQITSEGQALITRQRRADRVQKTGLTPVRPATPRSPVPPPVETPPNIVTWLQQMAEAFTAKAKALS